MAFELMCPLALLFSGCPAGLMCPLMVKRAVDAFGSHPGALQAAVKDATFFLLL